MLLDGLFSPFLDIINLNFLFASFMFFGIIRKELIHLLFSHLPKRLTKNWLKRARRTAPLSHYQYTNNDKSKENEKKWWTE